MSSHRPADVVRALRETPTPHDDYLVEATDADSVAITGSADPGRTVPPALFTRAAELGYVVQTVTVGGPDGCSVATLVPDEPADEPSP